MRWWSGDEKRIKKGVDRWGTYVYVIDMKTAKEIAKQMGVSEEYVRKTKGMFRYHQSYFWGLNSNADKLIAKVKDTIPGAVIVDSGNHFHTFVGSAKSGSAKDSYLWVTFKVKT